MARGLKRLERANTGLVEGLVFSYWRATSENRDWGEREVAFSKIKRKVRAALKDTGIQWDERTDRLLKDCALNYSSARMVPFLVYFCWRVRERFFLTESQEEKLSAVAREAMRHSDNSDTNNDIVYTIIS